jgi:hypothetical protein
VVQTSDLFRAVGLLTPSASLTLLKTSTGRTKSTDRSKKTAARPLLSIEGVSCVGFWAVLDLCF